MSKQKTGIIIFIAVFIVAIMTLSAVGGYFIIKKSGNKSDNNQVEDVSSGKSNPSNLDNKTKEKEYEALQAEIREVSRQAMAGEISQEEAQKRIVDLQKQSLELMTK